MTHSVRHLHLRLQWHPNLHPHRPHHPLPHVSTQARADYRDGDDAHARLVGSRVGVRVGVPGLGGGGGHTHAREAERGSTPGGLAASLRARSGPAATCLLSAPRQP